MGNAWYLWHKGISWEVTSAILAIFLQCPSYTAAEWPIQLACAYLLTASIVFTPVQTLTKIAQEDEIIIKEETANIIKSI